MLQSPGNRRRILSLACIVFLVLVTFRARAKAESVEWINLHVAVTDAETGQPINQARLTLQFRMPGSKLKLKPSKLHPYSAKTNIHGRYKFTRIPKGPVHLLVTADRHQAFGKEFEIEENDQVIEVKLKKPQPLL